MVTALDRHETYQGETATNALENLAGLVQAAGENRSFIMKRRASCKNAQRFILSTATPSNGAYS